MTGPMLSDDLVPDAAAALSASGADRGRLGARLRELRLASGLSLRALARELGISPSAVSQIERGSMQPSVGRLIAIVGALGVPLAAVFEERAAAGTEAGPEAPVATQVTRAGASEPVELDGGVLIRRLSPRPVPRVEFFESTYPPGATSTADRLFLRHDGVEVGTVTAGMLTIEFEEEVVVLGPGDSITFPCERAHRLSNRSGSEVAVATWLIVSR